MNPFPKTRIFSQVNTDSTQLGLWRHFPCFVFLIFDLMHSIGNYFLLVLGLTLTMGCGNEQRLDPVTYKILYRPDGFPTYDVPEDNPTTPEGVDLGRRLFYDPMLSGDGTMACATCHAQERGFSDNGNQFSIGIDSLEGDKNAMQLINLLWEEDFFWDGRSASLEEQALEPVINPIEMHADWEDVEEKLRNDPNYPKLFEQAFGGNSVTRENATKAIAQFERTLIAGDTRYHRWLYGRPGGFLTAQEQQGYELFFGEKAECFHCHEDVTFSDQKFHNNGLDATFTSENLGRFNVTGFTSDIGLFKTTTLINIAQTAPYMHDGRFATLEEVVEHYSEGVQDSDTRDPLIKKDGFQLTDEEKAALVAFMKALTDETFLTNPDFSDPFDD